MRLVRAQITAFGKLKNTSVDFAAGLNVFRQVNGFGKTTVAEFIRAMLYGFTYTRSAGMTDAAHFQPWSSAERFGGSLTVEHKGKVYRIERFFGATAKAEQCRVTEEGSGKEMAWQMQPGEYLLGLTADSYDRSAYYPQEAVELKPNDNLEGRLANLVQNSAEDFDKIQLNLRNYKRKLLHERGVGGRIAELRQQLDALERKRYAANDAKRQRAQAESRLEQIALERTSLPEQQAACREEEQRLRRQLAQASPSEAQNDAKERLRQLEERLGSMPPQLEADMSRCDELYNRIFQMPELKVEQRVTKRRWLAVTAGALALAGVLLLVLGLTKAIGTAVGVGLGVGLIAAAVASCFFITSQKEQKTVNEERAQLLAEYFRLAGRYVFADNDLESTRRRLWELRSGYQADVQLRETLKSMVKPSGELAPIQQALDSCVAKGLVLAERSEALLKEETELKSELKHLDVDAVPIEDAILAAREELAQAEYSYKVAETTLQLLAEAKDNLSRSYLPRLCTRTTQLMREISAADLEVVLDGKFSVTLREGGVTKPMSEFSRGTREMVLLCFRVALSELLYDGAIPFLLVDDALVNFDESNFVRATALLRRLSEHAQIVYFTCHDRNGRLAD